jgi:hypothetical protein
MAFPNVKTKMCRPAHSQTRTFSNSQLLKFSNYQIIKLSNYQINLNPSLSPVAQGSPMQS